MNRPRPLNKRRQVQFMIVLTILAWATQTLLHQWGYGAEIKAAHGARVSENAASQEPSQPAAEAAGSAGSTEKFVPVDRAAHGATIELRSEATIVGGEIKLKQVCRWTAADNAAVEPIGELVLARVGEAAPFKALGVDEIKSVLHDAGVNLAAINLVGATS